MPLTQEQLNAAHDSSANVIRVIAGPGTGKTFCIEERILWLLRQDVNPCKIHILSYTRTAANDLKRRIIESLADSEFSNITNLINATTCHSLALTILRRGNLLNTFATEPRVMDEWEQRNIFDSEYALLNNSNITRAQEIRTAYEALWNTLNIGFLTPISQSEQNNFNRYLVVTKQIYSSILPGEMIKEAVDNISAGIIEIAEIFPNEHLLVDEYQDLNHCDQSFIKYFNEAGSQLFICGDDDQSIYSFRHAAPQGIVNIPTQYNNSNTHILPDCFRCLPEIIDTGLNVVSNNTNRIQKNISSIYAGSIPGILEVWRTTNGQSEADILAESCQNLIAAGISPSEILILIASKNTQSPLIEAALENRNVPYSSPRGRSLKNTKSGRLLYAILRLLSNDEDYLAYRTILGLKYRVGNSVLINIRNNCISNNINFRDLFINPIPQNILSSSAESALIDIHNLRNVIRNWELTDTISNRQNDIINLLNNYLGTGSNIVNDTIDRIQNVIIPALPGEANLEELLSYIGSDNEFEQFRVLESISTRLSTDDMDDNICDQVKIMTYHSSKGLGANVVFLPGLEVGLMPDRHSIQSAGLLEERRRLFYVGITRARVACFISFTQNRTGNQAQRLAGNFATTMIPSPFIRELNMNVNRVTRAISNNLCNNIQNKINQITQ